LAVRFKVHADSDLVKKAYDDIMKSAAIELITDPVQFGRVHTVAKALLKSMLKRSIIKSATPHAPDTVSLNVARIVALRNGRTARAFRDAVFSLLAVQLKMPRPHPDKTKAYAHRKDTERC